MRVHFMNTVRDGVHFMNTTPGRVEFFLFGFVLGAFWGVFGIPIVAYLIEM